MGCILTLSGHTGNIPAGSAGRRDVGAEHSQGRARLGTGKEGRPKLGPADKISRIHVAESLLIKYLNQSTRPRRQGDHRCWQHESDAYLRDATGAAMAECAMADILIN